VMVQPQPGAALVVIQAELVLHLLVPLLDTSLRTPLYV
jgi:hypothetical protein